MNPIDPTLAVMFAVARRIALTHLTDRDAAQADYDAHVSAMSPGEIARFDRMIVDCAIQAA